MAKKKGQDIELKKLNDKFDEVNDRLDRIEKKIEEKSSSYTQKEKNMFWSGALLSIAGGLTANFFIAMFSLILTKKSTNALTIFYIVILIIWGILILYILNFMKNQIKKL